MEESWYTIYLVYINIYIFFFQTYNQWDCSISFYPSVFFYKNITRGMIHLQYFCTVTL